MGIGVARHVPDVSHDAVIVIPGIMGSSLYDNDAGTWLWGLKDLRWYVRAWSHGSGLDGLRVTEAEREGRTGRVEARSVLRFPAFAPWVAGLEPYTRLIRSIRCKVVHPAAVLEFPYDWRLPVQHNARLLAAVAAEHLRQWRGHPVCEAARRRHPDGRPAALVLVAHSMGGLLARALALPEIRRSIAGRVELQADDIRTTITLGTPFYGAVKAAMILGSGGGAPVPLPAARLQKVAASLPGVYDLLPTYRCVGTRDGARRLTPHDVEAIGGDRQLAEQSAGFHVTLSQVDPIGHRSLVGVDQPTPQALELAHGTVRVEYEAFEADGSGGLVRRNRSGDGTVYRESAALAEIYQTLPQQHGALAKTSEAISAVCSLVTRRDGLPRPLLGIGQLGLHLPDVVEPDAEWLLTVSCLDSPALATCAVFDLTGERPGRPLDHPALNWEDGVIRARITLPRPGLYRVEVSGGGTSPVTQLVLAINPAPNSE